MMRMGQSKPRFKAATLTKDGAALNGLHNVVGGQGGRKDPRSYSQYSWAFGGYIDQWEIYSAFAASSIFRRLIEMRTKDATRMGRNFNCEASEAIADHEKELCIIAKLRELFWQSRLTGGAVGLMLIDGVEDLSQPLELDRLGQGCLRGITVFDRFEVAPSANIVRDFLSSNFGNPEHYMIKSQPVHHSHVVRVNGFQMPRLYAERNMGWGESMAAQILRKVANYDLASDGMNAALNKYNVDSIKIKGLISKCGTKQGEREIEQRIEVLQLGANNLSMNLLDEGEELARQSLSLGGASEIQRNGMTEIAALDGYPVTRFWGEQAKGLGNGGEADANTYHESLRDNQSDILDPALKIIDQVLVRSAVGNMPDDYQYDWNPLHVETAEQKSNRGAIDAQTDTAYLELGIVQPNQVMQRLNSEGRYSYDDQEIQAQRVRDEQDKADRIAGQTERFEDEEEEA